MTCIPPPDVQPGTYCLLCHDREDGGRDWLMMQWRDKNVWRGLYDCGANRLWRWGFRFHSVAVLPGDGE